MLRLGQNRQSLAKGTSLKGLDGTALAFGDMVHAESGHLLRRLEQRVAIIDIFTLGLFQSRLLLLGLLLELLIVRIARGTLLRLLELLLHRVNGIPQTQIVLIAGGKGQVIHTGNDVVAQHDLFALQLHFERHITLDQLQLHDKVQLHRIGIAIATPIVLQLIEQALLELNQLLTLLLALGQVLEIGIDLGRGVLFEGIGGDIKLLNRIFSGFLMEYGQKHITRTDIPIVFRLLALTVVSGIQILPHDQIEADATFAIDAVEPTHQITKTGAVDLQLITRCQKYFDCLHSN